MAVVYKVGDRVEVKYYARSLSHTEFPEERPDPWPGKVTHASTGMLLIHYMVKRSDNHSYTHLAPELSLICRKQKQHGLQD